MRDGKGKRRERGISNSKQQVGSGELEEKHWVFFFGFKCWGSGEGVDGLERGEGGGGDG